MKKLQTSIKDATQAFDEILKKLFERKVQSEMVLYQASRYNLLLFKAIVHKPTVQHPVRDNDICTSGRAKDHQPPSFLTN